MNTFERAPHLDGSIIQEFKFASLDIATLALRDVVQLGLAEGHDLEDSLSLTLQLEQPVNHTASAAFRVVDSIVPERVMAKNARLLLSSPDFKDELLVVKGSFTYRRGASSPITLFHIGHIDQDRHLMTGIDTPGNILGKSMAYMPFVRGIVELK